MNSFGNRGFSRDRLHLFEVLHDVAPSNTSIRMAFLINEVGGATERVLINNGCAKSVTESLA